MGTQAATHKILRASTRKVWRHCPTSADTNSPKLVPIQTAPAPGMTEGDRRMEISAPGPLMFRWLRSATGRSGRFRASGPTTLSTPAPDTPTAQGKKDASTVTELL